MSSVLLLYWEENGWDFMLRVTLQTKKNVHVNKISEKYKKVLINLHQWLLGAEAENNIFLPLPDSLQ